jgi:hypothetical protein
VSHSTPVENRYCNVTQQIRVCTGIVREGRIENKAEGICTFCSFTKHKNVAKEVSVRNWGIGHADDFDD